MTTLNKGDTVYSLAGQAAAYIARSNAGHIVEPILEIEDNEEPRYGKAQTWAEVFTNPPTEKWHVEIAELQQKAGVMRGELADLATQRAAFDKEERARLARIKQHVALSLLDDYLAGKITHYVQERYDSIHIMVVGESKCLYNESGLRLLTLFGDSNGNLNWRINNYSDGSGSSSIVYPCTSMAMAETVRAERFAAAWEAWRKKAKGNHYPNYLSESATKQGLSVPDDVATHLRDVLISNARDRLSKLVEEKAMLEATLAKAGGAA